MKFSPVISFFPLTNHLRRVPHRSRLKVPEAHIKRHNKFVTIMRIIAYKWLTEIIKM